MSVYATLLQNQISMKYNLTLQQGVDFLASFIIKDANNNPVDISGLVLESQIRHDYDSNTALNFVCNGFSNGVLTITMPASNTATINAGSYVYDIESKDSSNSFARLIEGVIKVTPGVTIWQ